MPLNAGAGCEGRGMTKAEKEVIRAAMHLVDRWQQGCTYQAAMAARMKLEQACAALSKRKGKR